MKFNSHKVKLIESLQIALSKDKEEIIGDFKQILWNSNNLFKTDKFDFWLKQIGAIKTDEIPMTKYGLSEVRRRNVTGDIDRTGLINLIENTCEKLFTYSNEDDCCSMQSDYYYYFHIPTNKVFKESELGASDLDAEVSNRNEIRIAKVSELKISFLELVL